MESNVSTNVTEYPFALEWEFPEERFRAFKDSTENESLCTDFYTGIHASGFKYLIEIFPNGRNDENRGTTGIYLRVELGNEKKVESEFTISIADWNCTLNYVFDSSNGPYQRHGGFWTPDEFLDPIKEFIVDGKCVLRIDGKFKVENAKSTGEVQLYQSKWNTTKQLSELRHIGYEDFTVVAGGKEIQVHKCVLASHSPVFDTMFSARFNEGTDNRVEINDFPFEVVEAALSLCYHQKNVSDFSTEENAILLKFADKYDISIVKKNIEEYLSENITVSNLCEMVKIAEEGNALFLRAKCLDFFIVCIWKMKFVPNMNLLDNEFLVTAIQHSVYQKFQTL